MKKINKFLFVIRLIGIFIFTVSFALAVANLVFLFLNLKDGRNSDYYSVYYYIAVVICSLIFGVSSLVISIATYKFNNREKMNKSSANQSEIYEKYSSILESKDFIIISALARLIIEDYGICSKGMDLDLIEENTLKIASFDISDSVLFNYLKDVEKMKTQEFYSSDSIEDSFGCVSDSLRSVLMRVASITSKYSNGIINFTEFDSLFAEDIVALHIFSCILVAKFGFNSVNVRVRADLKEYFAEKRRNKYGKERHK